MTEGYHAKAHKKVQRIKKEMKEIFKIFMHDASIYVFGLMPMITFML